MIKHLYIILIVMLLSACLFMGETATKISANVFDKNEMAYSNCSIDLLVIDGDELHRLDHMKRQISFNGTGFEQVFVIGPEQHNYIVEIICDDSAENFRSKPTRLGAGLSNQFNLGSIVLKRK